MKAFTISVCLMMFSGGALFGYYLGSQPKAEAQGLQKYTFSQSFLRCMTTDPEYDPALYLHVIVHER